MKKHSGGGAQREEPHWAYKQLRLCTRRAFAQVPASVAGCAKRTKRCALCSEAKLRWTSSQAEKLDNLSKLCYGSGPTLPPALPRSLACFPSLSLSLSLVRFSGAVDVEGRFAEVEALLLPSAWLHLWGAKPVPWLPQLDDLRLIALPLQDRFEGCLEGCNSGATGTC